METDSHSARKSLLKGGFLLVFSLFVVACSQEKVRTAPAIYARDSVAVMTSYGVNTLISDSGVVKYRIVTERWEVNQNKNPSRWIFNKGLFLFQFDEKFHVHSYIQCDTAYYFDGLRKWELRGRVRILTKNGIRFIGDELFWDENKHELWSNMYSVLITPERRLSGLYFRSDERMTRYYVSNSRASFEKGDIDGSPRDTVPQEKQDSLLKTGRQPTAPSRKTSAATIPVIGEL